MGEDPLDDEPICVAVSRDVNESRLTLAWALRNLPVRKIYLVHVHQQVSMSPTSSGLEQSEIDAIQESELASTHEILLKYRDICEDAGVIRQYVDTFCNLANNVGEGIVELIYENNIKKLVMGAAADSLYSEGMVDISSTKAEYVSRHAPHCCKIWLVCNGNLIQTRDGQFDLAASSHSFSESLTALHGLVSTLIPVRAENDTVSPALPQPQDQSARGPETMYYEEQRLRLEIEELKREKEQYDKMKREREEEPSSSSFGVTQVLYNEEVIRRRKAEEDLDKANAEIENMKTVQKELEEQLYVDCPRLLEMFQKERDEAMKTTEELMRLLNVEQDESSSHLLSLQLQESVPDEPPSYFICPISMEIMKSPHVAADGYTYEEDDIRRWISDGGRNSPMTNLTLANHSLTPNLGLRSAINEWLQHHPYDS